jgi:translation initiation factor IF-1
MDNKLHVKPAEGRQVRREDGTVIPAEGDRVPNTTYYRRRLREGDLVKVESKTAKKGAE